MMRALAIVLCAGLSACVSAQSVAPGPGATAPRFEDGGHWISGDGFRLAFSVWAAKAPEAVIVALHGMNDYGEAFALPGKYWAERGITTYAFDQRGFGRTEGNGRWPGQETMVGDVRTFVALVRARHPGLPVYLMGESMGGAVALLSAGEGAGADGLILTSPAMLGWTNLNLPERAALWTFMQVSPGSQLSGAGLNIRPSDNDVMLDALSRDPYVIKRTRVDAVYGLVDLMEAAWQIAPKVTLPTIVVYAAGDQIVPVKQVQALVARMHEGVSNVCYSDGFHLLLRDLKGERAWAEIERFVDTRGAGPKVVQECR